eukprot:3546221-Pyramimonas_sp.AAC.1
MRRAMRRAMCRAMRRAMRRLRLRHHHHGLAAPRPKSWACANNCYTEAKNFPSLMTRRQYSHH